jgi:hypothetical protein
MTEHDHVPPQPGDAPGAIGEPYSAAKMFLELETPARAWRERHGRIQDAFVHAIDPLIAVFLRSGGRGTGEGHFAIRQVTARAINDLVVAVHLALHGYLNQSYNSLRMAIECMELRDLLSAEAGAASEWVNSDKPHRDFAPRAIRDRLQRPPYNELHGLFSERSHPRFEAAKLTGFMTSDVSSDVPVAVVRVGPFLLDGHPAVMEALLYAFDLAGQLTTESAPLVDVAPHLSVRDLLEAVRDCAGAVVEGGELIEEELRSFGVSGAQPVIERHRKIRDEVWAVLSVLDDHEVG